MSTRTTVVLLTAAVCSCLGLRLHGQQIIQAEYFFDTDLGVGQNQELTIVPGDTVVFSSAVPVTGLTPGYHYLYVRTKDQNGQWSTTLVRRLYIYDDTPPLPTPDAQLVSFEYHLLTDAGPGNGIQVPLTSSNTVFIGDTAIVTDTISVLGIDDGAIPIYARIKDSNSLYSAIAGDTTYRGVGYELNAQVRPFTRPGSQERFAVEVKNEGGVTGYGALVLLDMPNSSPARLEHPANTISGISTDSVPLLLEYYGRHFGLVFIDSLPPERSTSFIVTDRTPNTFPHNLHHFRFIVLPQWGEYPTNDPNIAYSDLHSMLAEAYSLLHTRDSSTFDLGVSAFDSLARDWLVDNRSTLNLVPVSLIARALYSDLLGITDSIAMLSADSMLIMALDDRRLLFADTLSSGLESRDVTARPNQGCNCKYECVQRNNDACNCAANPCLSHAPVGTVSNYQVTSDYCEPRCRSCGLEPNDPHNRHNALDISRIGWSTPGVDPDWTSNQTEVLSVCDGTVDFAQWTSTDCGNTVIINCCGRKVKYCHLSEILVSQGQSAPPGTPIGKVGCTGACPGCEQTCWKRISKKDSIPTRHIHIEILNSGALECLLSPPWGMIPGPNQMQQDCGGDCKDGKQKECPPPQDEVHDGDPNAKYGLYGYGPLHWVAQDTVLSYAVLFQNADTSQVSAQHIVIKDTLDASLDLSTFRPTLLAVGPSYFDPSDWNGLNWTDTLDTRGWNGVLTALQLDLDTVSRELSVTLQALDTLSGLPIDDVFAGVLPPDTLPPMGSGILSYTIGINEGILHGTVIPNEASIVFGLNQPIIAGPWVNTIDAQAPSSAISGLPDFTADTLFVVNWSGTDNGQSGVKYFDTYFAVNQDTLFTNWLQFTSDTAAMFEGEIGNTYYFYSVAVDSVGNREEEGLHFDAFTTVTISTPIGSYQEPGMNLGLFPNPTTGSVTLRGRTDSGCRLGLLVRNAVGQELLTKVIGVGPGAIMEQVDLSRLAVGTYFVTITCNDAKLLERLIRISE